MSEVFVGHIIGNCQRVETPKTQNHSRGTIYVTYGAGYGAPYKSATRCTTWSERGGVSRRLQLRTRVRLNTHALQLYGDRFPTLWRSEQRQSTTFVPKHHPGRKVGTNNSASSQFDGFNNKKRLVLPTFFVSEHTYTRTHA